MTDKEIEKAMQGLFRGASKVRAHKYANKYSNNVRNDLIVRIKAKKWNDEINYLMSA